MRLRCHALPRHAPVRSLNNSTRLLTALGCAGLIATAQADVWSFGGTRVAGMGGAGLALPFDVVDNNRLNPGMLGYGPKRVALEEPGLDFDLGGIDYNKVRDDFNNVSGGVTSNTNSLFSLGAILGTQQRDVALDFYGGVYIEGFAINGLASAAVETRPNAQLEAFSANPSSENLPSNAQLDVYGLGYYTYGLSYGHMVQAKGGTASPLSVGASVNIYKAYYSHQQGVYTGYNDSTGSFSGSFTADPTDMGTSTNDVSKSGMGIDIGALGNSTSKTPIYYGVVIHNLIEPNIKFNEDYIPTGSAAPEGATAGTPYSGTPRSIDPFKRRFDLGVGSSLNNKLLVAADWDDVGNGEGIQELGLGGEYKIFGNTAIRAGYNTLEGFTLGASIVGINLAVSGRRSLVLGAGVHF